MSNENSEKPRTIQRFDKSKESHENKARVRTQAQKLRQNHWLYVGKTNSSV